MAAQPPARCEICKKVFSTKKAAEQHANDTGHKGPVYFFCRKCDAHFATLELYNDHMFANGHAQLRHASTVKLPTYSGEVFSKPNSCIKTCAQCGEEVPIGDLHLKCPGKSIICPVCRLRFTSGEELAQHIITVSSCMSCGICLRPSETLADHLWTSEAHPKCLPCRLGFYKMDDFDEHHRSCQALLPAYPPAVADVPPTTINSESSLTTRVNTPFVVLDISQMNSEIPSWHCRSCLQDPCVDPVTTTCGHLFCHGCLVRQFSEKSCCPVCQKPFYLRLHAES